MRNLAKTLFIIFVFFVASCSKDDESLNHSNDSIFSFVEQVLDYWYFWYDELPDVDINNYSEPQDLVDAMTVEVDRWSFVDKKAAVNAYFQEGEDFGFGFFIGWDEVDVDYSSSMRIMFVYENTQAYTQGVRRGWTLLEIDGVPVHEIANFSPFFDVDPSSMTFKFRTSEGSEKTIELTKETYTMNGILFEDVFDVNSNKVGYMVYQSFLGYTEDELASAFSNFKAEGIDELIIDLRFNQGGYISIAHNMVNTLVPPASDGETFIEMKHNNKRSADYDTTYTFEITDNNLDLSRVFFITNEYSASASELVLNGLEPHMEVYSIGDNTYGKPVAMYGFEHEDWLFYPVTAKSVNADGDGDYFEGIAPDVDVFDSYHYDWGDINDPALIQAFNYITVGSFAPMVESPLKSSKDLRNNIQSDELSKNLLIMDR